jgi:AAA15 family ATPase/GTPase
MIQKISFQNFKLFKDRQTLEIRPMTILIGKNNTGKTAVVKLPTLIAGSLSKNAGNAPLKLENEGVRIGLSYEDLFYNRQITGDALTFEIESKAHQLKILIAGDLKYNIFIAKYLLNGKEINIKKSKFNGFVSKSHALEDLNLHFGKAK